MGLGFLGLGPSFGLGVYGLDFPSRMARINRGLGLCGLRLGV